MLYRIVGIGQLETKLSSGLPMEASTTPYAMVVDDDVLILMHACDILEEAGYRFYEAGSGDEAINLLNVYAQNVTLLFSDVEMPGDLNGFQLAQHVDRRWPHIEIVIASGRVVPRDGDMPEKATFIPKPFDTNLVHAHLQEKLPDGKKPEPLKRAT